MSLSHARAGATSLLLLALGCPTPKPVLPQTGAGGTADTTDSGVASSSSTGAGPETSADTTSTGAVDSSTTTDPDPSTTGGTDETGSTDESSSSGGRPVCELPDMGCTPASAEPWWDAGWAYRRRIEVLSPLAGPLDDAVVAIRLDEDFELACAEFSDPADDLRFVDGAGQLLSHEVERWEAGEGALVWVRLPTLQAGANDVWLYYGGDAAPPTGDVWPASLSLHSVMHFADDLEGSGGTPGGAPKVAGDLFFIPGVLGSSIHFEDILINRRVELTNSQAIDDAIIAAGEFTVSAWIRPYPDIAAPSPFKNVVGRGDGTWALSVFDSEGAFDSQPPTATSFFTHCDGISFDPTECDPSVNFNSNHLLVGSVPVVEHQVLANWHHVAAVFQAAEGDVHQKDLYVDGQLDATFTGLLPLEAAVFESHSVPVTIGTGPDDPDQAMFHGEIDEFHLASIAWSPERIEAEYELTREPGSEPRVILSATQCQ
ncbi:MAG: DUF2341 domain-containing protein [Myxococcota bacterium]